MDLSKLLTRPDRNYKFIDGIRAIAILWVIFFHVWLFHLEIYPEECTGITDYPWLVWVTRGDLGVDLFFVISGFLIGNLLFKEVRRTGTIGTKRFYVRRFLRLMPAYIACMIIGILLSKDTPLENWHMAWANLIYINNYIPHSFMSWTWSLAIEEQFYLVMPFLILVVFPRIGNKLWFFLVLGLLAPVIKYYTSTEVYDFKWPMQSTFYDERWHQWFWHYYILTHLRYVGLLVGVAIAYLHNYHQDRVQQFIDQRAGLVAKVTALSLIVILVVASISLGQWSEVRDSFLRELPSWLVSGYEAIHREIYYLAVGSIIMACLYTDQGIVRRVKSFLSLPFFFPVAQVSYSAYLFHEMWLYLYVREVKVLVFDGSGLPMWSIVLINGLISVVVILFVASLLFLFVEQPFQRLKEKWS